MNKLLVILGPTATGKTDLALYLAKRFNGELISCDSRQVYTGLDIGTGKLPTDLRIKKGNGWWEIDGIKVWMYDVANPSIQYTVADYVKDARRIVEDIKGRGKLPITVGGTGLYLRTLLYGLSNLSVPLDKKLRQQLEKLSISQLQEKLKEISPQRWDRLNYSDKQNPRRLIRAIELGVSKVGKSDLGNWGLSKEFNILKIGLTASRDILYQRADKRVVSRIKAGMIEESKVLNKEGLSLKRMRQLGLEYGILADFLEGKIKNRKELTRILQGKIHGFIRRQLTWFKKERDVSWFDITRKGSHSEVEKLVAIWYSHHDATQD